MSIVSLEDAIIEAIIKHIDPGEIEDAKYFFAGTTINKMIDKAFSAKIMKVRRNEK